MKLMFSAHRSVLGWICGGLLAVRLVGAFVAVSGTAVRPLPPILSVVAWTAGAIVLAAVAIAAIAAAAALARRALDEPVARRLRA